jgi:cysteinyl-tRNA synthetase
VREQDRIERELPGLRAASFLLARFAVAIGKEPKPEKILKEFDAIGFNDAKMSDFLANVVEGLPLTPDFTKRELALELYQLRHRTAQCANHEVQLAQARNLYAARKQAGDDLTEARTEVADAEIELEAAQKKFHEALQTLERYRKNLTRRIRSEAKRSNILRREHERSLGLD